MKTQAGYTLNELIATLAIMAVLIAFAIPSFSDMIRSTRLTTINNEIIGALNFARSEAVKRETPVIVKPNTPTHWESGWTIQQGNCTANCLIRTYEPLTANHTLHGKINTDTGQLPLDSLTFLPSGGIDNSGFFILCDTANSTTPEPGYTKAMTFNLVGHFKTVKDTNNNQLPEIDGIDVNSCE